MDISVDALSRLHGRQVAMLSQGERETLQFYIDRGRKFDVSISIESDADPAELNRAKTVQQCYDIYTRSNSIVRVRQHDDARYDLNGLQDAANSACRAALDARGDIGGAVNWGDLSCVVVERYERQAGIHGHRVVIEEASPRETRLILFIQDQLALAGYRNVDVVTAW